MFWHKALELQSRMVCHMLLNLETCEKKCWKVFWGGNQWGGKLVEGVQLVERNATLRETPADAATFDKQTCQIVLFCHFHSNVLFRRKQHWVKWLSGSQAYLLALSNMQTAQKEPVNCPNNCWLILKNLKLWWTFRPLWKLSVTFDRVEIKEIWQLGSFCQGQGRPLLVTCVPIPSASLALRRGRVA